MPTFTCYTKTNTSSYIDNSSTPQYPRKGFLTPHFPKEETEAQKGNLLDKVTLLVRNGQDLTQVSLIPKSRN